MIFKDDQDHHDFGRHLERILEQTGPAYFAWSQMPKHLRAARERGLSMTAMASRVNHLTASVSKPVARGAETAK